MGAGTMGAGTMGAGTMGAGTMGAGIASCDTPVNTLLTRFTNGRTSIKFTLCKIIIKQKKINKRNSNI